MTNAAFPLQQLRRHAGAAGAPTSLLSGQIFANEVEGVIYIGVGDNGSGISTAQMAVGFLLDSRRYKKAINANATLTASVPSGVLPVDAMIAFAQAQSGASPGSNTMQAATNTIPCPLGGDFETLVLSPWLTSLGYTSSSSPTIAGLTATLRAAALALSS